MDRTLLIGRDLFQRVSTPPQHLVKEILHYIFCQTLQYLYSQEQSGADPEIEEGGGHTYKMGIGAARVGRSCLCAR